MVTERASEQRSAAPFMPDAVALPHAPTNREPVAIEREDRAGALVQLWRRNEGVRFLLVGGWNTVFGYLVYVALYISLKTNLHYLAIGLASHVIAMLNAFGCHRLLVFRSHGTLSADFLRFNLSQLVVLGFALVGLWCLVDLLGMTPVPAQAVVTVTAVVLSYVAHRHFTFAK